MYGKLFRFGKPCAASLAFLFISLFQIPANASGKNDSTPEEALRRPLSEPEQGVVTGQLVTVAGNTFFQYFIAGWRDQPLSERYSITVHERPSAMRGNRINIDCLNKTIFAAILPNSRSDLKVFAERAVGIAYQNASQAEIQRLLFREADLGPDEL